MTIIEWDAIDIFGASITVFNYFIFIPLILYGLYTFNQHKDNEIITYRAPLAVILMNIIVIFGLMVERTNFLLATVFDIAAVPAWSLHFLFALTWDGLIYLKIALIYYVYFRQQYNLAIADMAWKQNINSEIADADVAASWFIKHRDTFGDMTYLMKVILFPYTFMAFLDAILPSMLDKTPNSYGDVWEINMVRLVEILIPVSAGFVILFKLRLLGNDIYHIRDEVFIAMSMMGLSLIVYSVVFSVRYLNPSNSDSSAWNRASSMVSIFIMDLVAFPCSILSTLYPVYLIKKMKMEKLNQLQLIKYSQNNVSSDLMTMDKILSEYTSFAAFMSYLVSEFCPETLLFLTELIQCKIAYQKRMNYSVQILVESENKEKKIILVDFNKNPMDLEVDFRADSAEKGRHFTYIFHSSGSIMTKLCLSTQIPTPALIKKYSDSLYWQMAALYTKYVKVGSQFELNISGSARIEVSKIFDGEHREKDLINGRKRLIPIPLDEVYSDDTLYNVMDEVAIEIIQLLQYSFSRFVSTESFHSINEDNKFEMDNNVALFVDNVSNMGLVQCPSQPTDAAFAKRLNARQSGILKRL